jgi:hypothetical protein
MAEPIFDAMGDVLSRWTMGSPAAPAASIWKAELGTDPAEAELRLLALTGQFLAVAVTMEPPEALRTMSDVPVLALPTVPDAVRPLVRRVLAASKDILAEFEILQFVAARGWTVHPGDWMPPARDNESTPDVYAPWRDWAESAASTAKPRGQTPDRITAENWDDWPPAARKVALAVLRQRDPAAARALLEAKLTSENAEPRLRLLELLESGLSEADIPFLESIAGSDRAPKVMAFATSLLARLSRGGAGSSEDAAELKGFFSVKTKGLLRRTRVIQFENVKTPAQRQRRTVLLGSVDIAWFAGVLGFTGAELIAAWPWYTEYDADRDLIAQVARSGSDALVMQAAEAVVEGDATVINRLMPLLPRLTPDRRAALAVALLHKPSCNFKVVARTVAGGSGRLEKPLDTAAGTVLLAAVGRADAKPADHVEELYSLGLITGHASARRTLERLNAAGLVLGDPRLDMLRLNEALEDRGTKP